LENLLLYEDEGQDEVGDDNVDDTEKSRTEGVGGVFLAKFMLLTV
jgi:hypothetical protein